MVKSERAQEVIRAGIEAGVVREEEITIVIVVNAKAELDIASAAPSAKAASLIGLTLRLALEATTGCKAVLQETIEMGKS